MKLRLSTLAILLVVAACSGGGAQMPATQPQFASRAIPASVNTFGFGRNGKACVGVPGCVEVITTGSVCDAALGVTGSIACAAFVFIPIGYTYNSFPQFTYSDNKIKNKDQYGLELYQGLATGCPAACAVGTPFTKLQTGLGQVGGYTADVHTIGCTSDATCGTNGFPVTTLPALSPPDNIGYVVNLTPLTK